MIKIKYYIMKKSVFISLFILAILKTSLNAQLQFEDFNETIPDSLRYDYTQISARSLSSTTSSSSVDEVKTIRVIVHIPLKLDGTGNYSETADYVGDKNENTGYWLANKLVERMNFYNNNNYEMTQQLSYEDIPVDDINIQYEFAGVIFHDSDYLYNSATSYRVSRATPFVDQNNRGVALNIFLYHGSGWSGATSLGHDVAWMEAGDRMYNNYIAHGGNWPIDNAFVHGVIHEFNHDLYLEHPKRYSEGACCTNDNSGCLDDCDDTPTYLELLADGYTDPCIWNGPGYSNNIMDYSPAQVAWTPCQIEQAHTELATNRTILYPCNFVTTNLSITYNVIVENKVYIAENITTTDVTVEDPQALYINCATFETINTFEVKLGAILEINPHETCY